jgi:Uncharacterised protein family (UPF0236)
MNAERIETPGERELATYREQIRAMRSDEVDLLRVEEGIVLRLKTIGAEMMVEAMKQADTYATEVVIDGERCGSRRRSRGTYQTMFGEIDFERSVYQLGGRGRLRIPMDLRLGIEEGAYTPKLTRVLTRGVAVMTEEDAAEFVGEIGLAAMSSSTFHRVSRAVAARYEAKRSIIEVAIREQDVIPDRAVTVQVGIDGVMVPQDGEHAMPRGRKSEFPEPPRHGVVGMGPAEDDGMMGRAWHEASVATLAFFNDQGTRLKTIYIARMPEPNKATTVATLEDELLAVLCERPDLNIVFASDGAAPQWAALEGIKTRLPKDFTGHTMDLVDGFHVAEYVQEGAEAIEGPSSPAARILAATWRETLKAEDGGAATVLRSMRARLSSVELKTRQKQLAGAIQYIANQNEAGRMNYGEALRRNYPIGTRITEAACKTIAGVRMKRAGSRFSQHGGQTVMTFRAAVLSGRFEALHEILGREYMQSVQEAA